MARGSEPFDLGPGEGIKNSGKALLVELDPDSPAVADPDKPEVWIPLACLHDDSEVYDEEHEGEVRVQRWFAEKQGWE